MFQSKIERTPKLNSGSSQDLCACLCHVLLSWIRLKEAVQDSVNLSSVCLIEEHASDLRNHGSAHACQGQTPKCIMMYGVGEDVEIRQHPKLKFDSIPNTLHIASCHKAVPGMFRYPLIHPEGNPAYKTLIICTAGPDFVITNSICHLGSILGFRITVLTSYCPQRFRV